MQKTGVLFACALVASLAGCAVEIENLKPAQELEARERPAGSVYLGWRVFEDRCARCHGTSATGKAGAPDLVARVRTLSPREFADLVLLRYRWSDTPSASDPLGADRQAYVDDVARRRRGELDMPAWQGEPRVTAHIIDLHAYLSARADGTQGPGRPAPPSK
jgi:mono/diheme cytochrome c family protein